MYLISPIKQKLEKFYDDIILRSSSKDAMSWLCFFAFIESFFFLVPPYVLMVPMILANKSSAYKIAFFAMVSSVLGGLSGYYIGKFFFELVAVPIFEAYGYMDLFESFGQYYHQYGLLIIFMGGLTPLPYKLVAIMSGAVGLNLWVFVLGSIVVRGIRFYLVAFVLYRFGASINVLIKKYILAVAFFVMFLLVFSVVFFAYM